MKHCKNCRKEIPSWVVIDGISHGLSNRRFCLECSPFGKHNTVALSGRAEDYLLDKRRTSIIWNMSKDDFAILVKSSKSRGEILGAFGLCNKGSNYKTIDRRIKLDGLSGDHLGRGIHAGGRRHGPIPKELSELLIEHSLVNRGSIKRRLRKEGLLLNCCALCSVMDTWNGKPLMLVLDHINGISDDYRLSNLRLLCPNCNSQQSTFAGRNKRNLGS